MAEARYDIEWDGERLVVEGEVPGSHASGFRQALAQAARSVVAGWGSLEIDMLDLELLDSSSVAETVKAIRQVMTWHREVKIHQAPQMLAHTLYKLGMLEDGDLELESPREDEGTTAN